MAKHLEVVAPEATPPVWAALRNEAARAASTEPGLASLMNAVVLKHAQLDSALSYQLARKLGDQELRAMSVREICEEAYSADPSLVAAAEEDLRAVFERDPACRGYLQPFLFFSGTPWRCTCRAGRPSCSRWTSIRPLGWGAGCSSTMAPAS
jgi:serine O-acetyltransferase